MDRRTTATPSNPAAGQAASVSASGAASVVAASGGSASGTPADMRDRLLAYLRKSHADICRHWFDHIDVLTIDKGGMVLLMEEPVRLSYLQRCCVPMFTEAAQAVTGRLIGVRFVGERSGVAPTAPVASNASRPGPDPLFDEQLTLSPDYVFENFVVGPTNRLCHAAAHAVAAKPGQVYNPFFVHGGVGLGKTHLLQAVCQLMLRRDPGARIVYISCDTFRNLFHDSMRAGRMNEFRHKFRHADMLVVDDIHFLSKHEQTQEEFFHTFNALYQSGRQIVLSSDAAPAAIPVLEDRLVSRFNSGLVAQLEPPQYETRVTILKAKAAFHGLDFPDDVAAYVAGRVDTNIRELFGALADVRGEAMLCNAPITLELAKRAMMKNRPAGGANQAGGQPTVQQIIDAVIVYYDIKLSDLMGKRRHKSIALPRQICMWLARKYTRFSLEEIGGYFGGRDHTTVMHAVRTVASKSQADQVVHMDVGRIEQMLVRKES